MPSFDANSFFEAYKTAVLNKDVDGLMALYDNDFVAFDMWNDWSRKGEGSWRKTNQEWLGSLGRESVLVEFDAAKTYSGAEIAGACAFVTFKAISEKGEILRSMQNRLTWVAARRGDAWKIVHQHTSAPIDSKSLSPILNP